MRILTAIVWPPSLWPRLTVIAAVAMIVASVAAFAAVSYLPLARPDEATMARIQRELRASHEHEHAGEKKKEKDRQNLDRTGEEDEPPAVTAAMLRTKARGAAVTEASQLVTRILMMTTVVFAAGLLLNAAAVTVAGAVRAVALALGASAILAVGTYAVSRLTPWHPASLMSPRLPIPLVVAHWLGEWSERLLFRDVLIGLILGGCLARMCGRDSRILASAGVIAAVAWAVASAHQH